MRQMENSTKWNEVVFIKGMKDELDWQWKQEKNKNTGMQLRIMKAE